KSAFGDLGALSGMDREGLSPQEAPDLPALKDRRAALDQLLEKLAAELTDAHLSREFVYIDGRGNERRYILWQAMVHIFNHQTHHRGGIAQILDERGITNDYSNIVWYIKAPG
ncbi:DinB family protein, partial [Salinispira pacifica]